MYAKYRMDLRDFRQPRSATYTAPPGEHSLNLAKALAQVLARRQVVQRQRADHGVGGPIGDAGISVMSPWIKRPLVNNWRTCAWALPASPRTGRCRRIPLQDAVRYLGQLGPGRIEIEDRGSLMTWLIQAELNGGTPP
jgi:hypothetical protein